MMTTQMAALEVQTFEFCRELEIAAPVATTFEAVLSELGPDAEMPDGKAFPMKIEPWPGGRWYRDLGDGAGHLWGHVQVIKPPSLVEICGPMFVSYPTLNHVQYRLTAKGEATLLIFTHRAHGWMPRELIAGVDQGWTYKLKRIGEIADRLMRGSGGRR